MCSLKMLVCAVLWTACFAWAATPVFEGKLASVRILEARIVPAPAASGAKETLRIVYLVSRREGVSGPLALSEPRDVSIDGRSYRATTRAEFAREFEPQTTISDSAAFFRDHPALRSDGVRTDGAFVIVVELFGATVPRGSEARSRLQVGFGGRTETGEFTFTPVAQ